MITSLRQCVIRWDDSSIMSGPKSASVFFCVCRSDGVCVCVCVCVYDTLFMGMAAGVMYMML